MITSYNYFLVSLSIIVAIFASYTALDLGERIRTSWAWIAASAGSLGIGIWSMHFIAMLGFKMGMPVSYDVSLTVISLGLAIAMTAIGFFLKARVWLGGLFMGIGIISMHYTGMAAMRMAASINYDPRLVSLSVIIAIGAATAALWLYQQKLQSYRILASVVMGSAIAGMHYIGMAAATFVSMEPDRLYHHGGIEQFDLALSITVATMSILGIALGASMITRHYSDDND
jgi:NO-binding membrane sensor protein with MHYT domain